MSQRTYLDWNATAPLRPQAHAAMVESLDRTGNPSSLHAEGRAARGIIETARRQVAEFVGAEPRDVTFTSGGTEANALALSPGWGADTPIVSAIEHPSVLAGGQFGVAGMSISVDVNGILELDVLRLVLAGAKAAGKTPLVSVMLANNETGVIQPVAAAADLVHEAGGLLHVDAVQAAGRIPIDISAIGADLLTLSAHKIGGPQGVGALVRRDGLHLSRTLLRGGGQERGLRAGTENVAALAGFGAAMAANSDTASGEVARMRRLQEKLEVSLCNAIEGGVVIGAGVPRLPNTTLVSVPGTRAETLLIALDLEGISVSAGSACSSGKIAPSHVLAAMGVAPDLSAGAIRVSSGYSTDESDIDAFLLAWRKCVATLLKRQRKAA